MTLPSDRGVVLNDKDISVALIHPGNRVDKITKPLQATDLDWEIEPEDTYERDIVLMDNPDKNLGFEVLKKPLHTAKLVYRMRGDLFHELTLWDMHPVKKWAAEKQVVPRVDGVIAVNQWMAEKMHHKAGVNPVGVAGLVKNPDSWPDVNHTEPTLRMITLTNANYKKKIRPILQWAPVVNQWLDDHGGTWEIGADGTYTNQIQSVTDNLNHVEFSGFVDAKSALTRSNLMLHPSNLDALPNSVLEGMASNLPVITNDFKTFRRWNAPIIIARSFNELLSTLDAFESPAKRKIYGGRGQTYLYENATAGVVGKQYADYFRRLLSYE